jgi:hypothetical protein
MGRSRRRGYAWVIILVADAGVLVYGVMAAVAPRALIPGYESYSSRTWPALVAADTQTAAFILLLFLISGSGSGWLIPAAATPSRKAANATAHHQR